MIRDGFADFAAILLTDVCVHGEPFESKELKKLRHSECDSYPVPARSA